MQRLVKEIWTHLVRYFFAGVFAILPLVVTVAIVGWVSSYVSMLIGPSTALGGLLKNIGVSVLPNSTASYIVGWLVVLLVVLSLGMVVEFGAKSFFSGLMERMFGKVPLIGSIYRTSKQVVEMLDTNNKEAIKGMSAVYCFFGSREGPTILAFLVSPQRFLVGDREYQIVMIPTAPVPFGGAMLLVPVEQVIPADISVDSMMSIYLSMGVTAPDFMQVADSAKLNSESNLKNDK
jgi:uncharacterized membrane protein